MQAMLPALLAAAAPTRFTEISIVGDEWHINGEPTFKGRKWDGVSVQGLLPNSRMVNALYDDDNAGTVSLWKYPDTNKWEPERHTNEFIAALPEYRAHGLLGVTVSLQGGSVCGNDPTIDKSHAQCSTHSFDKVVSAFDTGGRIKPAWFERLERVLEATDRLGMVVLLQLFYPKQARAWHARMLGRARHARAWCASSHVHGTLSHPKQAFRFKTHMHPMHVHTRASL